MTLMRYACYAALLVLLMAAPAALGQSTCTLTYITESLPGFTVGTPANFDLEACCGTEPYRFELIDGEWPDGLHMNQQGKIRGVPREVADVTVLILLSDDAGCTLGQAFAVRVDP